MDDLLNLIAIPLIVTILAGIVVLIFEYRILRPRYGSQKKRAGPVGKSSQDAEGRSSVSIDSSNQEPTIGDFEPHLNTPRGITLADTQHEYQLKPWHPFEWLRVLLWIMLQPNSLRANLSNSQIRSNVELLWIVFRPINILLCLPLLLSALWIRSVWLVSSALLLFIIPTLLSSLPGWSNRKVIRRLFYLLVIGASVISLILVIGITFTFSFGGVGVFGLSYIPSLSIALGTAAGMGLLNLEFVKQRRGKNVGNPLTALQLTKEWLEEEGLLENPSTKRATTYQDTLAVTSLLLGVPLLPGLLLGIKLANSFVVPMAVAVLVALNREDYWTIQLLATAFWLVIVAIAIVGAAILVWTCSFIIVKSLYSSLRSGRPSPVISLLAPILLFFDLLLAWHVIISWFTP